MLMEYRLWAHVWTNNIESGHPMSGFEALPFLKVNGREPILEVGEYTRRYSVAEGGWISLHTIGEYAYSGVLG